MKYKLICIDMDGTLLDNNHILSEENKSAIIEAHQRGITIAVTTGRLFASAKCYYDLLGITGPIIASNGTYIREKNKKDFIYKCAFSTEEVKNIYEITKRNNLSCIFYTADTALSSVEINKDHPYIQNNKNLAEEDKIKFVTNKDLMPILERFDGEILKGIAIENDNNKKEILFKVKEELKTLDTFEVVSSGSNNFEIMKKGSSKGAAVKRLSEILNIKREEIICIGDNENDLSMIKYAGLGIAMGNAADILKNEADYITDTNLKSGVAKAIRKFI
ncbi:Cof-type HAD-IIB family hydrolase [Clostridium sp. SHJSY1]|uniref:Cof-type HAD-IIB family hydrolase n=1 Tax=Clostridium sp. SHJSY1 TaxID=2942483 RepID=UPI0028758F14|nr:Cof-type HAD-IIB family hydrolase [Clostridium sp. SHJSY1]MDS0525600.1 Cof-type HAD-IIB family hydrolase [Clostridium sp. SHJSY1]